MRNSIDIHLELPDPEATQILGRDIALIARPGDVLCLQGGLGAGKSTLARAAVRWLADDPELDVPSPSFTLCNEYELAIPVRHFDLYRIGEASEIDELGIEDGLDDFFTIVEWPEIASGHLPAEAVSLRLDLRDGGRLAQLHADDDTAQGFAARIRRSLEIREFLDGNWGGHAERRPLRGDASSRRYETATLDGERRIVMDAPRLPDGPPVYDGKPYSRVVHLAEDVIPFVAVDELLRDAGLAAPCIHASDVEHGLLLIEHLGEGRVIDAEGKPISSRYVEAARLLARLHAAEPPRTAEFTDSSGRNWSHMVPDYDRKALMIEASLFCDWYVSRELGRELTQTERSDFEGLWLDLLAMLEGSRQSLVMRDYHSPNLIWREGREFPQNIGIIDFQDALIGPAAYDLASLGQDARIDISRELEAAIFEAYVRDATDIPGFDIERFRRDYAIMAAQRATKILGIFVRLDRRDGKPGYLAHIPRLQDYLRRSCTDPALAPLREWYATVTGLWNPSP